MQRQTVKNSLKGSVKITQMKLIEIPELENKEAKNSTGLCHATVSLTIQTGSPPNIFSEQNERFGSWDTIKIVQATLRLLVTWTYLNVTKICSVVEAGQNGKAALVFAILGCESPVKLIKGIAHNVHEYHVTSWRFITIL